MWRTGARILRQQAAFCRRPTCVRGFPALPLSVHRRQPKQLLSQTLILALRGFSTNQSVWSENNLDKERQRQQAQDDMSEETEEFKRERDDKLTQHDSEAEADDDLAPEIERLDPQSIPGLYPEFEVDEQDDKHDDSWYVDSSYEQQSPKKDTLPLWQRRASENLGDGIAETIDVMNGSIFDLCNATLREDAEVSVVEVSDLCEWTSRMLVAQAKSVRHMRAMSERLLKTIKERHRRTGHSTDIRVDGRESDDWIVVDMGKFIIHIMTPEAYSTYNIESLWAARRIEKEQDEMEIDTQITSTDANELSSVVHNENKDAAENK
ncbi:hypothetical protein H4S08_001550 [Coemansia sp. RSA 1365]|nr:hypothetical protein H4S08_001550 [Coemansia sp. RSA 1365]